MSTPTSLTPAEILPFAVAAGLVLVIVAALAVAMCVSMWRRRRDEQALQEEADSLFRHGPRTRPAAGDGSAGPAPARAGGHPGEGE